MSPKDIRICILFFWIIPTWVLSALWPWLMWVALALVVFNLAWIIFENRTAR